MEGEKECGDWHSENIEFKEDGDAKDLPNYDEVQVAIASLNHNRAVTANGLLAELLRHGGENLACNIFFADYIQTKAWSMIET